jgi:hypothetical protein
MDYKTMELYFKICPQYPIVDHRNHKWTFNDHKRRWIRQCQGIWESHSSRKSTILGWMFLHSILAIKDQLHHSAFTHVCFVVCQN